MNLWIKVFGTSLSKILLAAREGDLKEAKVLLKDHPDLVFSKDANSGQTPLHVASAEGHKDVVELLLTSNAKINAQDNMGESPLHYAVIQGHKSVQELLREHGGRDLSGDFFDAIKIADLEKVKALLQDNPNLLFCTGRQVYNDGETPLHLAVLKGHREIVDFLLASKADVQTKDNKGWTPLHDAAMIGHKGMVGLLLAQKSDVKAKDKEGQTSLHWAASFGHKDVAELLLANGANINASDNRGWTPLHNAAREGRKNVAELLLANKADVNHDSSGTSPLHGAAVMGHKDIVELLLTNKARINCQDPNGLTPLTYAKRGGYESVVEFLRQHGGR